MNLFLYGYGAIFNFLGILATVIYKGPESFDILQGHSRATVFLIMNNAAQGILSSFFFKYADTILKKYSSTVATIFTGIASAALFGHVITMNFLLGISIVFISMHQNGSLELSNAKDTRRLVKPVHSLLFPSGLMILSSTWPQEQMKRLLTVVNQTIENRFFPDEMFLKNRLLTVVNQTIEHRFFPDEMFLKNRLHSEANFDETQLLILSRVGFKFMEEPLVYRCVLS
ncbi:hypothetical protein F2Q68_00026130 [Brassica cretica]|uniref:Uncharacterized protein n=1 Tax=Brassica cretica TaxID=69181 RepID=A0A8S9IJ43_BRACR|nr:hypothetical protein F2Q68_00026130 [Brassica cretica]